VASSVRFIPPVVAALGCGLALAQSVSLSGSFGDKALLIIDGNPRTVATGATVLGVKLISVAGGEAQVEVAGKRLALRLGGVQVNLSGAAAPAGGEQIVLTAASGGHFFSDGSINGKAVRFLVDTGATNISMSQAEAERIGLKFRDGQRALSNTANGLIPVHRVSLNVVRVGDVQIYNVDATVVPSQMDHVLLGNSFLTRFQMKRENDTLTLDKRP
jgi:aspartyl protease family protein